jgi:hypothetical protein
MEKVAPSERFRRELDERWPAWLVRRTRSKWSAGWRGVKMIPRQGPNGRRGFDGGMLRKPPRRQRLERYVMSGLRTGPASMRVVPWERSSVAGTACKWAPLEARPAPPSTPLSFT